MININLFDKFISEFYKLLKFLDIEYISNVKVMNEGTLLSFNVFRTQHLLRIFPTFLFHDQLGAMYMYLNSVKSCSTGDKEEIYKRICLNTRYANIYVEYDGVANFRVINHYPKDTLDHMTRIIFIHNGAREDLLYSVFSLIFEYSIAGNKLDDLFGSDTIEIEKFVDTLKMMALSNYRYIKDSKIIHMNDLLSRETMLISKKIVNPQVMMKRRYNSVIQNLIASRKNMNANVFLQRIESEFRRNKIDYKQSMICTNSLNAKDFISIKNSFPYLDTGYANKFSTLLNNSDAFMKLRCVYGEYSDVFLATLKKHKLTFEGSHRESMLCSNKSMEEKMIRELVEGSHNKDLVLLKMIGSNIYLDGDNQKITCANKFLKTEVRLFNTFKKLSKDDQVFMITFMRRFKEVSHNERYNMRQMLSITNKLSEKEKSIFINFIGYCFNDPYRGHKINLSHTLSDVEDTLREPLADFSRDGYFANYDAKSRYTREIGYSSSAGNSSKDMNINLEIIIGFVISLFLLKSLYKVCCKFFSIRKEPSYLIGSSVNSINKVANSCDRH